MYMYLTVIWKYSVVGIHSLSSLVVVLGGGWVFVTYMLAHVLCANTGISLPAAEKSNLRNAVIR